MNLIMFGSHEERCKCAYKCNGVGILKPLIDCCFLLGNLIMQFHYSSTVYCKKKCIEWMLLLLQNKFCLRLTLCVAVKIHLLQV